MSINSSRESLRNSLISAIDKWLDGEENTANTLSRIIQLIVTD